MDIPEFGIGTYTLLGDQCQDIVYNGIKLGYRLIDSAELYQNGVAIGNAINQSISDGLITRDDIWITSKIHNKDQRHLNIGPSIKKILNDLHIDYIDLILLHSAQKNYYDAYTKLIECKNQYNIRHIGVSNFREDELVHISSAIVKPYINQLEISPFYKREKLRSYMLSNNIKIQAYCSLTKGKCFDNTLLQHNILRPDELLLSWAKQYNLHPIPTPTSTDHLTKNYNTLTKINISSDIIQHLNSISDQCVNYKQHMDKY